jgi:tetratricopeptide (TPR) repeat protein
LIEERLKQLGEEPGREFGVSLDRLKRKLEAERIGVLIDNLEPALDGNGKFIEPHRRYVELLRVLANPEVQSVALITSRECLRESAVTVRHYLLDGLDVAAWQEFFNSHNLETDNPALSAMHKAYGGNAKAMEILSSAIQQDYESNLEAYWQANQEYLLIERDLEDLVACQFNRLQQLDSDAYKLLCRMGCYRYQDVPTVPEEGLFCMLWDVLEAQRRRVVKSLRDRSLVEFKNGEYWLHPVIRAEAIARLRESEDWERANCTAAEFWKETTKNVTTSEEGLKSLEVCYHYVAIQDWEQASKVVLKNSENGSGLLSKLRGFGYIQKSTEIINFLLSKPNLSNCSRVELYAYLGDFYSIKGNLKEGINSYEEALKLRPDNKSNILYIDTVGALAFLYMRFCKYSDSLNLFEDSISYAKQMDCQGNAFLAYIYSCLSLIYKCINNEEKSLVNLTNAVKLQIHLEQSNRTWIKSYGLYTLGKSLAAHGYIDQANKMYNKLNEYAQEMSFELFKGFVIDGLAELELRKDKTEEAIAKYHQALLIFQKSGAEFHIAETYYHLGLAHQRLGKARVSSTNFQEAIHLFSQMEAPKQVEKVRRSMENGG